MSAPPDGGPAFPASARVVRHNPVTGTSEFEPITSGGMSLRDWFAGRASEADITEHGGGIRRTREQAKYAYADAMLEAREAKS